VYLFLKTKYGKNVGYYGTILSFFLWGFYEGGYRSYCITGIWHFFYIDALSIALMFFSSYFYIKDNSNKSFLLSLFFGVLCFTNHLIIGVILFLFIFCLTIEKLQEKNFYSKLKRLSIFISVCLLLAFLWPYYDLFDAFHKAVTLTNSSAGDYSLYMFLYNKFSIFLKAIGPSFLGLILIFKKKDNFIFYLFLLSIIYYIIGLPYWRRFLIPINFALQISFAKYLSNSRYKYKKYFIICTSWMIILFLIPKYGISGLVYSEDKIPYNIDFMGEVIKEKNIKVLSDYNTEYLIRAYYDFETQSYSKRIKDPVIEKIFNENTSYIEKVKLLEENSVNYLLLNKHVYKSEKLKQDFKKMGNILFENEDYVLYKIK